MNAVYVLRKSLVTEVAWSGLPWIIMGTNFTMGIVTGENFPSLESQIETAEVVTNAAAIYCQKLKSVSRHFMLASLLTTCPPMPEVLS